MPSKTKTLRQVETALSRAINAIENFDLPDENGVADMTTEQYADYRGWTIAHENPTRKEVYMPTTKAELQDRIDELEDFVSEVADGTIPLGEIQDTAEDLLEPEEEEEDSAIH